jgi:steroid 5-alpha reductase family enzyme
LLIVALGFLFNAFNAYVTARWISHFGMYETQWLQSPHFLVGLGVFAFGLVLNIHSDNILLALRKRKKGNYGIPYAGPFSTVSCPNYLGEIIQWSGWAILTWSSVGTAFALYTAANLVPRAFAHHNWYRSKFTDYPSGRKALIPGII